MSDNTPDFDNMTPEEIMAWMETLAKRQGASEGFTTAADMDIAEIDPNSVVIDEPGYVPYGQETAQPAPKSPPAPAPITPPEPARPAPPAATPLRPAFQPEPRTPAQPAAQVRPLSPVQPARPPAPPPPPVEQPKPVTPPAGESALAWLESLAADQSEQLFNLDLSDLPTELGGTVAATEAPVNPMTWLEDLARAQSTEPSLEALGADEDVEESEKLNPFAEGVNPMEWLETLARRQGAKQEELTTRASMNIPAPPEAEVEDEEYQPFSFDTLPTRRSSEPAALENPADWLNSIAGAEGYSEEGVRATRKAEDTPSAGEEMSLAEIEAAIANGTVTREQMQYFLDQQASQLAGAPEEAYETLEESDAVLEPADLPDWLSQLRPETPAPEPTRPIDALFEQPAAAEMPDWLGGDALSAPATDIESIFEPDEEASRPLEPAFQADLGEPDRNDPWVEAFDEEYEQGGLGDTSAVPEWYEQNVNDPARIAAFDSTLESGVTLTEAALPEENGLPAGQPQPLPSWMSGSEAPVVEAEPEAADTSGAFGEMPDWLKEVEASVSPEEVPDWLVETIGLSDQAEAVEAQEEEPPAPVYVPPPMPTPALPRTSAPTPVPAPLPARAPLGDVAAVLERARDMEQSGDLEGALAEYESLIRSGAELETAVADLGLLVKSYKTTPAVYRVLGDGLMRQGKLQAALNTYREALNQL